MTNEKEAQDTTPEAPDTEVEEDFGEDLGDTVDDVLDTPDDDDPPDDDFDPTHGYHVHQRRSTSAVIRWARRSSGHTPLRRRRYHRGLYARYG